MNNWWIAALEHAGIWTREQAEHVSENVKNTIHRETYKDAFDELAGILHKGKFEGLPLVSQLETDVQELKHPAETPNSKK